MSFRPYLTLLSVLLLLAPAPASAPGAWEFSSYQDFLKGKIHGLALSKDGRLTPAPSLDTVFAPSEPFLWSATAAPDGTTYLATGHRGRLYQVDPQGKGKLLWTADRSEIFAVTLDAKGTLYAATSPNGKVYRIAPDGQATVYFDPKARYIWALETAPDGTLFVATGDGGKIFRVAPDGKAELYADTNQTHVTALALDSQGRLLAGSEPNGILYRVDGPRQLVALYDSPLTEVRRILPQADGSLIIDLMGGATARKATQIPAATPATSAAPATFSITVTDTPASTGKADNDAVELKPATAGAAAPLPATTAAPYPAPLGDAPVTGDKSQVLRIRPGLAVDTLWTSKDESAFDIADGPNGSLYIATDGQGRLYQLDSAKHASLIATADGSEIVRLIPAAKGLQAISGTAGRLLSFSRQIKSGDVELPVQDAGGPARWGQLQWTGSGQPRLFTRSGNTARPDQSWSPWVEASDLTKRTQTAAVASPSGRFLQAKVELSGSDASLNSLRISYLPHNQPPVVRTLSASASYTTLAIARPQPAPAATSTPTFAVTVSDTGESTSTVGPGTPSQTIVNQTFPQLLLIWVAEDPDGDRLVYDLDVRAEGEPNFHSLKKNLTETSLALDPQLLGDGRFTFRVTASDRLSNPADAALQADLIGPTVLLDSTAPTIVLGEVQRKGPEVRVPFTCTDAASPLKHAEYSLDGGLWQPLQAQDGIIDSPVEAFLVRLSELSGGEHVLVVRVADAAENAATRRIPIAR